MTLADFVALKNPGGAMHERMAGFLQETAAAVCGLLEKWLPSMASDWWRHVVLPSLTDQQRWYVERRSIASLSQLDLPGLLRILDRHWYQISNQNSLLPEVRHYLKELQVVRNRWAHAGKQDIPGDDVYRDLDTLQRFLSGIGLGGDLNERIEQCKKEMVVRRGEVMTEKPVPQQEGDFKVGQVVALRSEPSQTGAVIGVMPSTPEDRYQVFIGGEIKTFYRSQLSAADVRPQSTVLGLSEFQAHLSALHINHPSSSSLYSLNSARIDFIPYQFRPVLKFIHSDRPRLLIADSVGVGKTIEAGLILKELQARQEIRSVLIICPRQLVVERKWELEMKRFDEKFTPLDSKLLRFCIDESDREGVWPDQHAKTILPYSVFDVPVLYGTDQTKTRGNRKGLLQLDPPPRFDLVIVDEAQHILNPETYTHKGVRFFCDNAEAVLFLSATPIQLGNDDLYVLLNTLRPDLIIDKESFEHMSAPNPHINAAIDCARSGSTGWQETARSALQDASNTGWGRSILRSDPTFQEACSVLESKELTMAERVSLIGQLERLHSFAGIINRTRRRDIGDFTIRKPETVSVPFTPAQNELHKHLLSIQASILMRLQPTTSVRFLMTMLRRQAASCLFGLVPSFETILTRRLDELRSDGGEDDEFSDDEFVAEIESDIRTLLAEAKALPPTDPKLQALEKIIVDKQSTQNNKIMVFSTFRPTLNYLAKKLSGKTYRVALVHGDTPDEERLALRNRFKLNRETPDAIDVLLFSEIGSEGLDYQFCDCIVNYDLPWNPMKIEQRIGRIDRKGQQSEKIAIYNLITPGTIDADIYERCLKRIGVFNRAIGGSEEILGRLAKEIKNVAENIKLTDDDKREKLQQLADNEVRLLKEQEDLEEKQAELFGIRVPADQTRKAIEDASSYWLSSRAVQNLVQTYLDKLLGTGQEYILGEKPLKTLRVSQTGRELLLRDFQKLQRQVSPVYRLFEGWLKGNNPHLSLAFEASCALENPDASFITPIHPLVRLAANAHTGSGIIATAIKITSADVPPGVYPFALYEWQYKGLTDETVLVPIMDGTLPNSLVAEWLQYGKPETFSEDVNAYKPMLDKLEDQQYSRWSAAKRDHQQRVERLADYRRESLTTSHKARMAVLGEQIRMAANEKIRIMRRAQTANAEADYARRLSAVNEAVTKADIVTQLVAWGVITAQAGGDVE